MRKLINLPVDILLYILNSNFSLQGLFHLRLLCHRFQSLIESRHCFGTRKSLKLFWSFDDVQHFAKQLFSRKLDDDSSLKLKNRQDDDLILNRIKFNRSTCAGLERFFPNLSHLLISHDYSIETEDAIELTGHYPFLPLLVSCWPNLIHLSFFGIFNHSLGCHKNNKHIVQEMCSEINDNLLNLKRLDLCAEMMFFHSDSVKKIAEYIPMVLDRVLPKLEQFLWTVYPNEVNFVKQYLHKLNLECSNLQLIPIFQISEIDDAICQILSQMQSPAIQHLTIFHNFNHLDRVSLNEIDRFTGLRSLRLKQGHSLSARETSVISITDILLQLTNLTNLIELNLEGFELYSFRDTPLLKQLKLNKIVHLTICDKMFTSQIREITFKVFFSAINLIFPSVCTFQLQIAFVNEEIVAISHLSQFAKLTRFELRVKNIYPLLLSEKFRQRYEDSQGKLSRVDLIDTNLHKPKKGRQIWKRMAVRKSNKEEKQFVWTKCDTIVW